MQNPAPPPLLLAWFQMQSLLPAWQSAKHGLLSWNPNLQSEASQLVEELEKIPQSTLHEALREEASGFLKEVLTGVQRYLDAPIALAQEQAPVLWQEGSSVLYDYSKSNPSSDCTVLFVPSLINRSYIFDLRKGQSFLGFMKQKKIACALLDWGEPGEGEQGFQVDHYIARLQRTIEYLAQSGKKMVLAGYCMGGLMSLASASLNPEHIAGLALFATPWDFHAKDATRFNLTDQYVQQVEAQFVRQPVLPKLWMQMMFYLLYAPHIHKKFQTLATIDLESQEAQELLAIEYWANDGVGLASGIAKNCLVDWGYHNTPFKGEWCVNGTAIIPESIDCKTLVAIAKHDRIASYHAALPLAEKIPGSDIFIAETGHVGMVAGRSAKQALWEPFARWVSAL